MLQLQQQEQSLRRAHNAHGSGAKYAWNDERTSKDDNARASSDDNARASSDATGGEDPHGDHRKSVPKTVRNTLMLGNGRRHRSFHPSFSNGSSIRIDAHVREQLVYHESKPATMSKVMSMWKGVKNQAWSKATRNSRFNAFLGGQTDSDSNPDSRAKPHLGFLLVHLPLLRLSPLLFLLRKSLRVHVY